jgi:hypothetical protein
MLDVGCLEAEFGRRTLDVRTSVARNLLGVN